MLGEGRLPANKAVEAKARVSEGILMLIYCGNYTNCHLQATPTLPRRPQAVVSQLASQPTSSPLSHILSRETPIARFALLLRNGLKL